jgi:hypothetical protein
VQSKGAMPQMNYLLNQRKHAKQASASGNQEISLMNNLTTQTTHLYQAEPKVEANEYNFSASHGMLDSKDFANQLMKSYSYGGSTSISNSSIGSVHSMDYNYYFVQPSSSSKQGLESLNSNGSSNNYIYPSVHQPSGSTEIPYGNKSSKLSTIQPIENSFDAQTRDLIKTIHQSYQVYLMPLVDMLKTELNNNNYIANNRNTSLRPYNVYAQQQQPQQQQNQASESFFNEVMDYFRFYARKFACFSDKIPG